MEAYGIATAKQVILEWFRQASIILLKSDDEIFSSALFDCFHVDVAKSTIAFRFNREAKVEKYLEDDYEVLRAAYHNLRPELTSEDVVVYDDVPFEAITGDKSLFENHPISAGYCKESELAAKFGLTELVNICPKTAN